MGSHPERREQILTVSEELFAEKGIASTTVREIGDAAGVFSGSLYHYFKSKDAIVVEMLTRYVARVHDAYAEVIDAALPPIDTLRAMIDTTLRLVEEYPHPTAVWQNDQQYLRENGLLEEMSRRSVDVAKLWYDVIERGVKDGVLRDDIPVDVFYRSLRIAVWQWQSMQWIDIPSYSRAELTDHMTRLFLDGFAARRSRRR